MCRDKDVGKIDSIVIGHNNKGLGAGWCLSTVEVKNLSSGCSASFIYDNWIPSPDDPPADSRNQCSVTLTATAHVKELTR